MCALTQPSLLRPLRDFLLSRNFDRTAPLVKFFHQHVISQRINPYCLDSTEILSALLMSCLSRLSQDISYLCCFHVCFPKVPFQGILYGISFFHQTNFYSSFRNPLTGTSVPPLISPECALFSLGFSKCFSGAPACVYCLIVLYALVLFLAISCKANGPQLTFTQFKSD